VLPFDVCRVQAKDIETRSIEWNMLAGKGEYLGQTTILLGHEGLRRGKLACDQRTEPTAISFAGQQSPAGQLGLLLGTRAHGAAELRLQTVARCLSD
jgi:hypothetical protein